MKKDLTYKFPIPRFLLYFVALILCGILIYLRFFYTNKFDEKELIKIYYLCKKGNFDIVINKSKKFIKSYPNRVEGHLWLAIAYDQRKIDLENKMKLRERYIESSKDKFYSEMQRANIEKNIKALNLYIGNLKKLGFYENQSKSLLKKAESIVGKAPRLMFYIAEAHYYGERLAKAKEILDKIGPMAKNSINTELRIELLKSDIFYSLLKKNKSLAKKSIEQFNKALSILPKKSYKKSKAIQSFYLANAYEILKKDSRQIDGFYRNAVSQDPHNTNFLYNWAKKLANEKRYIEAENIFKILTRVLPSWKYGFYELAKVQAINLKRLQALLSLERALDLEKFDNNRNIYKMAAKDEEWKLYKKDPLYLMLIKWNYPKPKKFWQDLNFAVHYAMKRYKYISVQKDKVLEEGIYIKMEDNFNKALFHLNKILTQDKDYAPANLVYIFCLIGKKYYRELMLEYVKANKEKLKKFSLRKKEIENTIENIESYCKTNPLDLKEIQKEIKKIEKKLETKISAEDKTFFIETYFLFKYYDEAIAHSKSILKSVKDNYASAIGHFLEGICYQRLKKYEEAEKSFELSSNFAPGIPIYSCFQINSLIKLNKKEKALQVCKKIIKQTNNLFDYKIDLAKTLISLKEYSLAIKEIDSLQLNLSLYNGLGIENMMHTFLYAEAWYNKAKSYILQEDKENALLVLEKAFKNFNNTQILIELIEKDQKIWKKVSNSPKYLFIKKTYFKE